MKNLILKIICLILVLCMALSAFVGCKKKQKDSADSVSSGEETIENSDDEYEDEEYEDEEYEEEYEDDEYEDEEYEDEWLEELPLEEEEEVYYEELLVKNTTPSPTYFRGINYIHQMASYQKDSFGRLYTDKQRAYELEIMKNMGVKMIRAFYGSAFTYNGETGEQDYNSQRMKDFFTACKAMDSIGIEVGVTPIWHFSSLVKNETSTNTKNFQLGCPGIVVKDDWNATLKNYREFMQNTVLALKANGVNNVKYFFAYTECNNTFNGDDLDVNGEYTDTSLGDREYDRLYPLFNDLITALDGSLKDAGLRKQYKIVGPCDNWRADDGSEPISLLVKYTIENLADKVDIIGSHNGYDRANEYVSDMYYEIPPQKLTYPMEQAKKAGKEYWVDEYNVATNIYGYKKKRVAVQNIWKGVAVGAMTNSIMNMGDISNIFLWTLFDEQWPDNTNSDENGEFDNGIQINGYISCLFETQTPHAAWYSVSLLTRYVGEGNVYPCEGPEYAQYISAIKRNDGETTVVVTNYELDAINVKINFEKSMGGKNFYRYIYDTTTIEPISSAEMIAADAVAEKVKTGFCDTLPAGSVAIYTTEKPDFVK
jgi:hypothetical protein